MQLNNYHSKIFKAIFDMDSKEMKGLPPIPDVSKGIDYALSTLSEREQEILFMRYEQELTLKCIGENVGLTRSRIQQIVQKALRRLRHPYRAAYIRYGFEGYTRKMEKQKEERAAQRRFNEEQTGCIDKLNLSVRAYNCLRRCGIATIAECATYEGNPLKIRNLGFRSAHEVAIALRNYGIKDTVWDEFL